MQKCQKKINPPGTEQQIRIYEKKLPFTFKAIEDPIHEIITKHTI